MFRVNDAQLRARRIAQSTEGRAESGARSVVSIYVCAACGCGVWAGGASARSMARGAGAARGAVSCGGYLGGSVSRTLVAGVPRIPAPRGARPRERSTRRDSRATTGTV